METHADRLNQQRYGFQLTKIRRICQSRGIFFRCYDDFLFPLHGLKTFDDLFYFLFTVRVMVGKC